MSHERLALSQVSRLLWYLERQFVWELVPALPLNGMTKHAANIAAAIQPHWFFVMIIPLIMSMGRGAFGAT